MAFDPGEALREAGILNSPLAAEVEEAFATLTREEVDLLISLKDKLPAALPGVLAHAGAGGEWSRPEVESHTVPVEGKCLCGADQQVARPVRLPATAVSSWPTSTRTGS